MSPPSHSPSHSSSSPPPFPITAKDHENLARTDASFEPHTWSSLHDLIRTNALDSLRRWPSDLKRYLHWTAATKAQYGTITNYICQERLHWHPLPVEEGNIPGGGGGGDDDEGPRFEVANETPFADERDYKILVNDWPYGLEEGITHLVVWLKNRLQVEGEEGDLTEGAKALVEAFVEKRFREKVQGEDRVMWFRNWTGLQSVRGLEHVHVLVRGAEREGIEDLIGGRDGRKV
ncbi:MAG: hypothetical protein Q9208_001538 [Pyrenodesmia sp. 3 TL-2023]